MRAPIDPQPVLDDKQHRKRMQEVKSVLVVEDDVNLRELLVSVLREDFEVMTAGTAEQALACLHRRRPDIILCDVYLRECSGYTLVAGLRLNPETAGIPVVITSGWGDESVDRTWREVGAVAFLPKPFTIPELRKVLLSHVAVHDNSGVDRQAA